MTQQMKTPKEVGKQLSLCTKTIYRYINRGIKTKGKEGLSPVVRTETGLILIPETTIENFIEKHTCVS